MPDDSGFLFSVAMELSCSDQSFIRAEAFHMENFHAQKVAYSRKVKDRSTYSLP